MRAQGAETEASRADTADSQRAQAGGSGGPLAGVRVLALSGLGPGPFCATLLAELGAEVVEIQRRGGGLPLQTPSLERGRVCLPLDLKSEHGRALFEDLVTRADVLQEGYRPGVMERLGLGPDRCLELNPRLIYGRMTGWGQEGPLAREPGHDLNYLALSGALSAIGPRGGAPTPPLNLLADFGGGALYLALGICAALVERSRSGQGQVIDCAMIDGVASLLKMEQDLRPLGLAGRPRGENLLDGGAPFYRCYETADGGYFSVAALEPQFYARLREALSLDAPCFERQWDRSQWPAQEAALSSRFLERGRDEWAEHLNTAGACCAPVLDLDEVPTHPHHRARGSHLPAPERPEGPAALPRPAPRFSRSEGLIPPPATSARDEVSSALQRWGIDAELIERGTGPAP